MWEKGMLPAHSPPASALEENLLSARSATDVTPSTPSTSATSRSSPKTTAAFASTGGRRHRRMSRRVARPPFGLCSPPRRRRRNPYQTGAQDLPKISPTFQCPAQGPLGEQRPGASRGRRRGRRPPSSPIELSPQGGQANHPKTMCLGRADDATAPGH
jgi:hypothetical protein